VSPENQPTSKLKKKINNTEFGMIDGPKLSAYDVNWFNTTSLKKECLKFTLKKNLSVTQEGQLTFPLGKCQTTNIKTAFMGVIGMVGTAARKVFYPLPLCREKLISRFLELIYFRKSIMVNDSKDSFQ
jgi:hypothetical protein